MDTWTYMYIHTCTHIHTHLHTYTHTHTHTHVHALPSVLTLYFNSTNYIINEDEGPVTVCLEKSRQTDRNFSVTINYSEASPAEAQGKIKVEPLVKTTILCRHYKGVLLVQASVCGFTLLLRSLQSLSISTP